jgi:hypothetical protein
MGNRRQEKERQTFGDMDGWCQKQHREIRIKSRRPQIEKNGDERFSSRNSCLYCLINIACILIADLVQENLSSDEIPYKEEEDCWSFRCVRVPTPFA